MAHFASYAAGTQGSWTSDSGQQLLGANAQMTPMVIQSQQEGVIAYTAISDQPGTLWFDQSFDGVNWDYTPSGTGGHTLTAGTGIGGTESIVAPFVQVRYTNTGTSAQTYFRLYVRTFGTKTG